MPKLKLAEEMVRQTIKLKSHRLSNGDIIRALALVKSTFYRWISDPKNKLRYSLSEGQER